MRKWTVRTTTTWSPDVVVKGENGKWMFHSNVHGTEYVSPMQQMLGSAADMAITSIYRPRKLNLGGNLFGDGGFTIVQNPDEVKSEWMDAGARNIMAELMDQYDYYTTQGGITPYEYESIAKAAMGISGIESQYGTRKFITMKDYIPDILIDLAHVARGYTGKGNNKDGGNGLISRGVFQEKVGNDYIGTSHSNQINYKRDYERNGMSLSNAPVLVDKSPRHATQSVVNNVKALRGQKLFNKFGKQIPLQDALMFQWKYGDDKEWSQADVINDDYVKQARNYSNKFEYLK